MKAIVLAAGRGRRFTKKLPKCLAPLNAKKENLLSRYLDSFRALNIRDVVIVVGYRKDKIISECRKWGQGLKIKFIFNKQFKKGSIVSLRSAIQEMNTDCLLMDADVFFPTASLKKLITSQKKTAFLIDQRSKSSGEEMMLMARQKEAGPSANKPVLISKKVKPGLKILGEATGILKISKTDAAMLSRILVKMVNQGITDSEYEDAYTQLMQSRPLSHVPIGKVFWTEMDFPADLAKIRAYLEN